MMSMVTLLNNDNLIEEIKMISNRIKELIMKAEQEKIAREFWEQVEQEAEKYGVAVDYYLAEFY
jgi:hypothetical protein